MEEMVVEKDVKSTSSSSSSTTLKLNFAKPTQTALPSSMKRREKRELLHQMSSKIHSTCQSLSKMEIVQRSLDIVCEVTSSERATVYLISEDGSEVVSYINKDPRSDLAIRVKIGQGIAGSVAKTGSSVVVNDPYHDKRFDKSTDVRTGYKTRNMMTVPITTWKVRERERSSEGTSGNGGVVEITRERCIIGCVQVLNKKSEVEGGGERTEGSGGYTEEDLHWLEEWNTLIGVSLNQAHNHERFIRKVFKKEAENGNGEKKRMLTVDNSLSSKKSRVSE